MANLIYSGSGINAPEEFLYQVQDNNAIPFEHNFSQKLLFVTLGRDLKTLCGVVVEGKQSHIFKLDLKNKTSEKVLTVDDNAVYYPIISPSGDKIAFLETVGKSYPPMRDDTAAVKVLVRKDKGWELENYQGETLLDPFDWGRNDDCLLIPDTKGNLVEADIKTGKTKPLAENIFYPRLSHSTEVLAYYNGEAIVVETNGKKEVCKITEDAQYVFFDAADKAVYYVAPSGFWQMAVFEIPLDNLHKTPEKIFETSEITFAGLI